MSKEAEEEILDNVCVLFDYLKDSQNQNLVDAVYFFVNFYGLEMDELPTKLFDGVSKKLKQDAQEANDEQDEHFEFKELRF